MLIIPSIDLRSGRVVRLRRGDYSDQLNYDVDPVAAARRFVEQGAHYLHVVDLDGAKAGRPMQGELIAAIAAAVPAAAAVQVGGGVREEGDVDSLLSAGAARVVIGTRAVGDLPWLKSLLDSPRLAGRIVLALDARDGVVATNGWTQSAGVSAVDVARQVADWRLAAILYTDVARDGLMQGPNYDRTSELAAATKVPVIASGGVGSIDHVERLKETGCWAAIVGRSLYEGTVDLREAIRVAASG